MLNAAFASFSSIQHRGVPISLRPPKWSAVCRSQQQHQQQKNPNTVDAEEDDTPRLTKVDSFVTFTSNECTA